MKNDIADILFKYTTGEATLEETNDALKEAEAGFNLEPGRNEITPDELALTTVGDTPEEANGFGLLDTGTGSMEKVHVTNGKLDEAINQVNHDGTTKNLREDEVGWHAGDGRKATGGNETTLSIEIIMDGSGSKEDRKAEENGVLLAALLLKKHGLSVNELYTHNHWMGHPDSIVQGARKNCPLYILPHWAQFKQKVAAKLTELNGGATTTEAGKTEIMGKAKASAQQMAPSAFAALNVAAVGSVSSHAKCGVWSLAAK